MSNQLSQLKKIRHELSALNTALETISEANGKTKAHTRSTDAILEMVIKRMDLLVLNIDSKISKSAPRRKS